jgi:hypothetical protein
LLRTDARFAKHRDVGAELAHARRGCTRMLVELDHGIGVRLQIGDSRNKLRPQFCNFDTDRSKEAGDKTTSRRHLSQAALKYFRACSRRL